MVDPYGRGNWHHTKGMVVHHVLGGELAIAMMVLHALLQLERHDRPSGAISQLSASQGLYCPARSTSNSHSNIGSCWILWSGVPLIHGRA